MAKHLARNPTVLKVGDTVFAHAGIHAEHVAYGLDRINAEVSRWMNAVPGSSPPKQVLEEKGVVWTRDYGGKDAGRRNKAEAASCVRLASALKATGATRMIVGHTPQVGGINAGCGGAVWRVDVGSSRGIYGAAPQVLEIHPNGRVRVLA